ncbi:MAG: hypothetical protein IPO02_06725 [Bacteroidetes bacterium]|nr:hypothetical protein [Bacteroidota bacterium]
MKKLIVFAMSVISLLSVNGCKKKPAAGLGGSANLKISAKHHGANIDSCTIYIKFNSSEAPDNLSDYDLSQHLALDANGYSNTIFSGLKKGDYYIFAYGWDPAISANIKGGIPYTIKQETDIETIIPVTEE